MFSAEFMDMTQSLTVNIANQEMDTCSSRERPRDARSLPGASASGSDQGFKDFLAGLSKTNPKEVGVEIISFLPTQ